MIGRWLGKSLGLAGMGSKSCVGHMIQLMKACSVLQKFHVDVTQYCTCVSSQDIELKVAIVELITKSVDSQPGLLDLFLSVKASDHSKPGEVGVALHCVCVSYFLNA